jgi:hypothetical protein
MHCLHDMCSSTRFMSDRIKNFAIWSLYPFNGTMEDKNNQFSMAMTNVTRSGSKDHDSDCTIWGYLQSTSHDVVSLQFKWTNKQPRRLNYLIDYGDPVKGVSVCSFGFGNSVVRWHDPSLEQLAIVIKNVS